MFKFNYSLLNFCGINLWKSNLNNLPFKFVEMYLNACCISILPIDYETLNVIEKYRNIKNLYNKMLPVLGLEPDKLSKIEFYYNKQQIFSQDTKIFLSDQILSYCPKMIIVFGDIEFLDHKLLDLNKIYINYILHPNYLLSNIKDKVIAYNDLLKCKKQLKINA